MLDIMYTDENGNTYILIWVIIHRTVHAIVKVYKRGSAELVDKIDMPMDRLAFHMFLNKFKKCVNNTYANRSFAMKHATKESPDDWTSITCKKGSNGVFYITLSKEGVSYTFDINIDMDKYTPTHTDTVGTSLEYSIPGCSKAAAIGYSTALDWLYCKYCDILQTRYAGNKPTSVSIKSDRRIYCHEPIAG